MLAEFWAICEREGFVKPTVYQGLYSILDRRHEGPLLDFIREHDMVFTAHSPIASGFLHGGLTSSQVEGTRFSEGNIMSMDARRYDTDKHHEAIHSLDKVLKPYGIPKPEAALRWLAFHSHLGPQDAIVFGASKIAQVKENIASVARGPLPAALVAALDDIWQVLAAK